MKTPRKSSRILIGNIILVISFAVIIDMACQPPVKAPIMIRVGYLPMVSSLAYFVAAENQYFIDELIDIQAMPIRNSNSIASELIGGNIEAAIELSIVPLLQRLAAGQEPKFLIYSSSNITADNGFDSVIVLKASPLHDMGDLSGKRVGVFQGTTAISTFKSVFKQQYPNLPEPQFIQLDSALQMMALMNNEIDALHAYEPTLSIGIIERNCRKICTSIYASQYSPNPIGVGAVNAKWYREHKKEAKAFLRAMDRAVRFIRDCPEDSRRILSKYTGSPERITEKMNIMPMSLSTEIELADLNKYITILYNIKEIQEKRAAESIVIQD